MMNLQQYVMNSSLKLVEINQRHELFAKFGRDRRKLESLLNLA